MHELCFNNWAEIDEHSTEYIFLQLEIMLEPQVWREAATQVFFALGLGFGGVIAFSSYNKRDNNCHFDAVLVSVINFLTSILATLVVFAVLGFKANIMNEKCVVEWVHHFTIFAINMIKSECNQQIYETLFNERIVHKVCKRLVSDVIKD